MNEWATPERARLRRPTLADALDQLWPFASPLGPLPDPTPSEGPDPYGNPDPEWLRVDWREHLQTTEIATPEERYGPFFADDAAPVTRVNYVELGSGPGIDLVFVHGLSGCWQNWLENLPRFARRGRVIALDLPGFGASPMPPWPISVERYGRLVHDFVAALGVGDCAIVGNSLGGFIAAEAAIHRPDRFERLVLISAAGVSHARMRREPAEVAGRLAVAASPLVLKLQQGGLRRPQIRRWAFGMVFRHPLRIRYELLWEYFHNGAGRPGFLPSLGSLIGYDILDRLEEVEVPTLIVWGRDDRIVPPADALEYGARLRNSETVIFGDTGHVPMAERPVRFNRLLDNFLIPSSADGSSPHPPPPDAGAD
ncbi:MAG TPA: alpha/beta hydrolase [Solirubrobacterales bacterium]|nr:alpha/beta hydrolase [Solirubrobacterales bacterium]